MGRNGKVRPPAKCHPKQLHYAKGLCSLCYQQSPKMRAYRKAYIPTQAQIAKRDSYQHAKRNNPEGKAYMHDYYK